MVFLSMWRLWEEGSVNLDYVLDFKNILLLSFIVFLENCVLLSAMDWWNLIELEGAFEKPLWRKNVSKSKPFLINTTQIGLA